MAWNQTDLTALEDAIKSGALRVKYTDKEVEYRSLDEMIRIREMIRKELGLVTNVDRRKVASTSKGFK